PIEQCTVEALIADRIKLAKVVWCRLVSLPRPIGRDIRRRQRCRWRGLDGRALRRRQDHARVGVDARAAWGLCDNRVDPFRTYRNAFETSRWPLSGCSARPSRSAPSCSAQSWLSNVDSGWETVEPCAGSKGIYDFGKRDAVAPDGTLIAPDVMRGRVETGLSVSTLLSSFSAGIVLRRHGHGRLPRHSSAAVGARAAYMIL